MSSVAARPAFGGFVDKARRPTRANYLKILARARAAWDDLEAHLAETYRLTGVLHFMYGEWFGWALRFRRGGRFVVALYPNRGRLTAQIVLGRSQVAAASAMDLAPSVTKVLAAAKDVSTQEPKKAFELERQAATKLKSMGVKIVPDVDKAGFQKIGDPYLDKLAKELGPHAEKIKDMIRSIN